MNLYRVETTHPSTKKFLFVDWYEGATEADALVDWAEDIHRYGLPENVSKVVRLATQAERDIAESVHGGPFTVTELSGCFVVEAPGAKSREFCGPRDEAKAAAERYCRRMNRN